MANLLDLALGGPIRYCAAQAVYQQPAGHGFDRGRPRWQVYQGQLQPEGPTLRSSPRRLRYCAA